MKRVFSMLVLLPILACALSTSSARGPSKAPEKMPKKMPKKMQSALVCKQCHEAIYNQWKDSRHARSTPAKNPLFAAIYKKSQMDTDGETKLYCIRCHAPVSQVNGDVELAESVTNEGVTCDVCHTLVELSDEPAHWPNRYEPGRIKRTASDSANPKGHGAAYSKLIASSEICSGCHGDMLDVPGTRSCGNLTICDTDFEWKKSPQAKRGQDCKSCHMPTAPVTDTAKGAGRQSRDHRFPGAYFPETLNGAVALELDAKEFGGEVIAALSVTNTGAAHLLPTGPPARLAFVKLSAFAADGSTLWSNFDKSPMAEDPYGVFHIVFADAAGKAPAMPWVAARIVKDTRLRPGETRKLVYKLPADGVHRLEAEILYRLAPPALLDKLKISDPVLRKAYPLARVNKVLGRAEK